VAPKKRRKAPSGTYWKKGRLYARDPRDGRYRSTGTDVPEQAEILLAKWRAEAWEQEHFPRRAVHTRQATLQEAVDAFLNERQHKKSIDDDRERLGRVVVHFGPDKPLVEIGRADIVAFLGQLTTKGGKPAAPATRNRYRAALRTCFKVAVQNGMAIENPVSTIKLLPEHNERDRIASRDEEEALIDAADQEMKKLIVIAIWTGMRLSEILGIQPKHIDWKVRSVKLGRTKSGRSRTVPMARPVVEALKDFEGFKLTAAQASQRFRALTAELGIEDLRFHDLRHTACTRMRQAGIDVFTMASISGHETLDMLRRYMTITEEDQLKAMAKVEGQNRRR
jgi:integrase